VYLSHCCAASVQLYGLQTRGWLTMYLGARGCWYRWPCPCCVYGWHCVFCLNCIQYACANECGMHGSMRLRVVWIMQADIRVFLNTSLNLWMHLPNKGKYCFQFSLHFQTLLSLFWAHTDDEVLENVNSWIYSCFRELWELEPLVNYVG